MSSDLVWLLVRKNNSFIKKKNGVIFSTETGNIAARHSYKYSGLANSKAFDVAPSTSGSGVVLKLKTKSGKFASTEIKKDGRKVAQAISNIANGTFYRRDLQKIAQAKATALVSSQKKTKKPVNGPKKPRGKKALKQ